MKQKPSMKTIRSLTVSDPDMLKILKSGYGFLAVIVLIIIIMGVAFWGFHRLREDIVLGTQTYELLNKMGEVFSDVKDAETGKRGYLLTSDVDYLKPYLEASQKIENAFLTIEKLIRDNPVQNKNLETLKKMVVFKMDDLKETVLVYEHQGLDKALQKVRTDKGKDIMDQVRLLVAKMVKEEKKILDLKRGQVAYHIGIVTMVMIIGIFLILCLGVLSLVNLNRTIQEQKQRVLILNRARKTAEEASQSKSKFLATMSHELRTPLNAIIGFSEILGEKVFGELNAKQERYVSNILASGKHLLGLINDILDISKVEAGKIELELSMVNIRSLLEACLVMVREMAMKKGINLDLKVNQELLFRQIEADAQKLKQVMFNLLSNAVKFTPKGGKISIAVELVSDSGDNVSGKGAGDNVSRKGAKAQSKSDDLQSPNNNLQSSIFNIQYIRVSVTDTGIGIEPEDQERVFGEFEQIDSTYARKQEGTGLGLALTRHLVELFGGRIWVHSKGLGKGSAFAFTIPFKINGGHKKTDTIESSRDGRKKTTVLMVEDDSHARELLSDYLTQAGYGVVHALTGEEVIEKAEKYKPVVITLDIILPGRNGFAILKELKAKPDTRNIPVIVISIVDEKQKGFALGADRYFVKPIEKQIFLDSLESLIDKK
ncbi:MAG: response regulator [Desulfobacula sp.]|jgi:signal transduction histidine kinase/CheY-like chemotaxis protein|nr:response regulator [Desulfobacula sp.]MBT6339672.1 response regulator [Desulfobacula sp.]MBT7261009.1 response regulator [Desulfobacula sp.]